MYSIGKTVYTVNNKTNKVDTWTLEGVIPTGDTARLILRCKQGTCILPAKCVFDNKIKALEVAKKFFLN